MKTIGKAIKTQNGYEFIKEFYGQGYIYKYLGNLNEIGDDYPIYSAEYQDNEYETKATLKKLCKGTAVNWEFLFETLDWACAETAFYELEENAEWFF